MATRSPGGTIVSLWSFFRNWAICQFTLFRLCCAVLFYFIGVFNRAGFYFGSFVVSFVAFFVTMVMTDGVVSMFTFRAGVLDIIFRVLVVTLTITMTSMLGGFVYDLFGGYGGGLWECVCGPRGYLV